MSANLERYLDAATRPSTRRTYAGAVRHFEVEAGRPLPATGEQVAQYLADYADTLAVPTLRHRLAALGRWHRELGFNDPTKAPVVRQAFKGIRLLHSRVEKQAHPLQLTELGQVADRLEHAAALALEHADAIARLQHLRNRAIVLLGFWRGFRGDELLRLQVEHLKVTPGKGMSCFLPHSKGDRQNLGTHYKVPALSRWCPVQATVDWIAAADLTSGPLFRAIDRWGGLSDTGLHANSFVPLLRGIFRSCGLSNPDGLSGHSLRRGFAGWAESQGWDLKTLMSYVGWRDVHSAMRYLDADPFSQQRMEAGLPQLSAPTMPPDSPVALPAPVPAAVPDRAVELIVKLTPYAGNRDRASARRIMEGTCLSTYGATRLLSDGSRYRLNVPAMDEIAMDEAMAALLDAMYRIADNQACYLEASLFEPATGRCWN